MNVRHNILSRFLGVLTVMVFALLGITSCSETETTDKTDFILYYTSMTDIGPGMSSDIAQPSYKGATPSDFTITGVTLDGQAYTGNLFEINPTSGTVHIESDETTPVGVYKISVSCVAGGSTFTYNDIISVNFLKRVPEGITVTPEAYLYYRIFYLKRSLGRDYRRQQEEPDVRCFFRRNNLYRSRL